MDTNATNRTTNYGLPLFIGTDKPAWLVDWNNTMTELDTKLKEIADAGDNTAILAILGDENSGLIHNVQALSTAVTGITQILQAETTGVLARLASIDTSIQTIETDLAAQNASIQQLDTRVTALENA